MKKIAKFFASIKLELGKVIWPNKKNMFKYSVATISVMIVFALFFTITDLIISGLKMLVA